MKKTKHETSKTHEVKSSSGLEPLMDTKAQIFDPGCAYHLINLHFDLSRNQVRGEGTFRVVESGLYYQVMPFVHHFPEFISWLTGTYSDDKNYVFSSGAKILEITPELIQKSLVFPTSYGLQSFTDVTLVYHYVTLPPDEQQSFLKMILVSDMQSRPRLESFPITLFIEPIQPILSIISCLLGEDDTNMTKKWSWDFCTK